MNKMQGNAIALLLEASAARTTGADGTGKSLKHGAGVCQASMLLVEVSAVAGTDTPTLDIHVEDADAVGGSYADVPGAVVPSITATGIYAIFLPATKSAIRAVWAIAGTTPSFTFSVIALGLQPTHGALAAQA